MPKIVIAPPAETSTPAVRLADCSPTQQIESRYVNAAKALLEDAAENDAPRILVDVLTWTLARVVAAYGTPECRYEFASDRRIAGELLMKLGIWVLPRTGRKYIAKRPRGQPRPVKLRQGLAFVPLPW